MKKDWDTIAAVEKAIAQKYGKLAVQDFRAEWAPEKEEEYLKQIKSRRHQNKDSIGETIVKGDVVINKRNKKQKTERTCPVCKTYSFSRRDDLYMNRFDCCERCYIVFVVNREERWRDGWRPDDDQVKISLRRKK
tara:strand:- start:271 stop:675 length:405 start_codon:yes stop_codon:yes gene_type:complete